MTQTDVPPFVSIVLAGQAKGEGGRKRDKAGWGPSTEFWVLQNDKDPPPMLLRQGDPRWCKDTGEDLTYNVLRKLQLELTRLICVITLRNKRLIRNHSCAKN